MDIVCTETESKRRAKGSQENGDGIGWVEKIGSEAG